MKDSPLLPDDHQPTRANIVCHMSYLTWLLLIVLQKLTAISRLVAGPLGPGDSLFFYFSGHGVCSYAAKEPYTDSFFTRRSNQGY